MWTIWRRGNATGLDDEISVACIVGPPSTDSVRWSAETSCPLIVTRLRPVSFASARRFLSENRAPPSVGVRLPLV